MTKAFRKLCNLFYSVFACVCVIIWSFSCHFRPLSTTFVASNIFRRCYLICKNWLNPKAKPPPYQVTSLSNFPIHTVVKQQQGFSTFFIRSLPSRSSIRHRPHPVLLRFRFVAPVIRCLLFCDVMKMQSINLNRYLFFKHKFWCLKNTFLSKLLLCVK